MTEHAIQLRRAWESPLGRIDLPNVWDGVSPPRQLRRIFHRPPLDVARDQIVLQLKDVAGLVAVRLNGHDLAFGGFDRVWEHPIHDFLALSNRLELDLEPAAIPMGSPWGSIALVIRGREVQTMENLA